MEIRWADAAWRARDVFVIQPQGFVQRGLGSTPGNLARLGRGEIAQVLIDTAEEGCRFAAGGGKIIVVRCRKSGPG